MEIETKIVVQVCGEEKEVVVRGRYYAPTRGRVLSDPSDCYPFEEAEAEVTAITFPDGKLVWFPPGDEALDVAREAILIEGSGFSGFETEAERG